MSRTAQSAKAADADTVSSRPAAAKVSKPARGKAAAPGRITFVGSGPGDPGLLTLRAQQTIAQARTVYTDPDVPAAVLELLEAGRIALDVPIAVPRPRRHGDPALAVIEGQILDRLLGR